MAERRRLRLAALPPIDRGAPSAIEGIRIGDVPRAWLPGLQWQNRYYADVPKREDVNPDERRPHMALDDLDDDTIGDGTDEDISRCHHGVVFDEDCDACDDEMADEGFDEDDDDRDQGGES